MESYFKYFEETIRKYKCVCHLKEAILADCGATFFTLENHQLAIGSFLKYCEEAMLK